MAKEKKTPIYAEIPSRLKERIERLARLRDRKLTAEITRALERYCNEEEAKEGIFEDDD